MATPVLDLETAADPTTITINKRPYVLRRPDDLTIAQISKLDRILPRFVVLTENTKRTAAEDAEFSAVLMQVTAEVVDAPPKTLALLRDLQRLQIALVFTQLRAGMLKDLVRLQGLLARGAATPTHPRDSTGSKSSRGSNGSTAATRTRG